MSWTVRFEGRTAKEFAKLDKATQTRIYEFLVQRHDRHPSTYSQPLTGRFKGLHRMRIGDYRLIFDWDESSRQMTFYAIGHRRDIYE